MKSRLRQEGMNSAEPAQQGSELETPTFTFVKREFNVNHAQTGSLTLPREKQEKPAQTGTLASSTTDLRKTFFIASLIFLFEAVLYFAWK